MCRRSSLLKFSLIQLVAMEMLKASSMRSTREKISRCKPPRVITESLMSPYWIATILVTTHRCTDALKCPCIRA